MSRLLPLLTSLILLLPTSSQSTGPVDHIVVSKSDHTLTLYSRGAIVHRYLVALGKGTGPKRAHGDARTPEGRYVIDGRNPHSAYHLALHISYPNATDRSRAAAAHVRPGGDVEIQGLPPGSEAFGPLQHTVDWTVGCIALSNAEIEQVYKLVPNGTPIDINP